MEWTKPQRHPHGPTESERLTLGSLSDDELEAELTIAALAGGTFERGRYDRLLRERRPAHSSRGRCPASPAARLSP